MSKAIQLQGFVNSIFRDSKGQPEFVAIRHLDRNMNWTTKLPVSSFKELPEQHDGVAVEVSGKVVTNTVEKGDEPPSIYKTVRNCKVLEILPGAGKPAGVEEDAGDAFEPIPF